jgi:predicted MFS family arabinose efflux permease
LTLARPSAIRIIIFFGFVSLFADATYEGARAIHGPFLLMLGASAMAVGLISGVGELLGFGLRLASGLLADKSRQYWLLTFLGYGVNVVAVPLLAFAPSWQTVAMLVVLERVGKSVRAPARDVMLSEAATAVGAGWGFGLHAAMDQIGAVIGPLVVAAIYAWRHEYRDAFLWLGIPALLTMALLTAAKYNYPKEEVAAPAPVKETRHYPRAFWIYIAASALLAMGYADYSLIGYHLTKSHIASQEAIPLFYAMAMAVNAVGALVFGKWYDKQGIVALIAGTLIAAVSLPLCFLGGFAWAIGGMIAWGAGMGAIDAVLRAGVSKLVSMNKRGSAFGLFNAAYGIAWFVGSLIMGRLYDGVGAMALVVFGVVAQLGAVIVFLWFRQQTEVA